MRGKMTILAAASAVILAGALASAAIGVGRLEVKLGVCDWTIGKAGDPAALAVAGRLGLAGVQVSLNVKDGRLALSDPALRRAYLEAAERTGVAIASLCIGELNNVPLKSDPRAEAWLEEGIGVAKAMNVGLILVPFFGKGELRNDPPGLEAVVRSLQRLAPKAEASGVVLALESYLNAADNAAVLEKVGSAAVRVYYDVGNSQAVGDPVFDEIRRLGGRIAEVHAKDTKDLYGRGSMDFMAVRRALEDIGFRGWLVLEGTEMPLGVEASVRYDADFLRSVFFGK